MLKADPIQMKAYKNLLDKEAEILLGSALRYERVHAEAHNIHVSQAQIKERLQLLLKKTEE
jgi:hypothetical protein